MKPRVFKRGSWWRQVDSGVTMYAAPTIPLLSDTVKQGEHPWFKREDAT
jgi:hypothetical protein